MKRKTRKSAGRTSASLRKFVKMRDALLQEKAGIEARLKEINAALGTAAPAGAESPAPATSGHKRGPRRGWKRLPNPMSLREAVIKVTATHPLTKLEIIEAVKKLGYQFASENPANRLGVLLYGKNPKFNNDGGKFSPA